MTRRLLASYLTLTVFVLIVLEVPLGISIARHERRVLAAEVERDAFVLGSYAEDVLEGTARTDLTSLVGTYGTRTGARVVVVDRRGYSIADSDATTPGGRNFGTRPEIATALAGKVASGIRHSATLDADLLYVAVPVASGGIVHGAVRITFPTAAVDRRVARSWLTLGLVAVVAVAASVLVGWRLAVSVTRALRSVEQAAGALAHGNLSVRAAGTRGPPEVRSLACAFNQMAERMEELVTAQRAFVADASHQLRTPLTALRLRVENLEAGASAEEIDAVASEVARLERIVDGLLALARAEGVRSQRRHVDVARTLLSRADAWEPLAEERSVRIVADAPEPLNAWEVSGALDQALDNLLANALEAVRPGGTIRLTAVRSGSTIEIHVIDDGPGMTDAELEHAFDRFWTRRNAAGTGIGLAIVRQLARASGGEAALTHSAAGGIDAVVRLEAAAEGSEPRLEYARTGRGRSGVMAASPHESETQ